MAGLLLAPWVAADELLNKRTAKLGDADPAVIGDAVSAASELLFLLAGRKYPGILATTIRPVARPRGISIGEWAAYISGYGYGSYVSGWGVCYGGDHQACLDWRSLDLGVYPVVSVDEVRVDGTVLDAAAYKVEADRYLVRLDGGTWPTCQDPASDPEVAGSGAFAVTLQYGEEPPVTGKNAVMTLATEFALAWSGKTNRLPSRLNQINRQGVQWTVFDPMVFLKEGRTGIYDVDLFLAAVNPSKQKGRPAVLSPDLDHARRSSPIASGGS